MNTAVQKPHINVDYFEDLTGDISAPASLSVEEIGVRIKTIREEKGISLQDLSKLTGFDVEALSDIEANRFQPQLGTIIKLSKALDSAFGRIVSGVGSKLYSVTRKNERKIVSRSTSYRDQKPVYLYKSLAPEVKGRHMESLIVQLEVNPDADMSVHEGEEFIYVLQGKLEVWLDEVERYVLDPGDSLYFESTQAHRWQNLSAKETSILWVNTPATF